MINRIRITATNSLLKGVVYAKSFPAAPFKVSSN